MSHNLSNSRSAAYIPLKPPRRPPPASVEPKPTNTHCPRDQPITPPAATMAERENLRLSAVRLREQIKEAHHVLWCRAREQTKMHHDAERVGRGITKMVAEECTRLQHHQQRLGRLDCKRSAAEAAVVAAIGDVIAKSRAKIEGFHQMGAQYLLRQEQSLKDHDQVTLGVKKQLAEKVTQYGRIKVWDVGVAGWA